MASKLTLPEQAPGVDEDSKTTRTGNLWTASAHVITAVIGSGVLSLAWSVSQFGWSSGPVLLFGFAGVTYYASILLTDCYRSPDPLFGKRNTSYTACVQNILGGKHQLFGGISQYVLLTGAAISYTITSGSSMVNVYNAHCHPRPCTGTNSGRYLLIFGAVQLVFSQIPSFHKIWWLSILATVMSFCYSLVGLGLSIDKTFGGSSVGGHGSTFGEASLKNTWNMLQALGNIAFAYGFSSVLIEIQDTLKTPAGENATMKKAVTIGVSVATLFYMAVACFGYAAFGSTTPGNILSGFHGPLVDFANICLVIHLVGGYQVVSQAIFASFEEFAQNRWPESRFVTSKFLKMPLINLVTRTLFVVFVTFVSLLFPFFNSVIGLVGSITFWPLTVYFPVKMYSVQHNIKRWSMKWCMLQVMSLVCLLISLASAIGSIRGIIDSSKNYKAFQF